MRSLPGIILSCLSLTIAASEITIDKTPYVQLMTRHGRDISAMIGNDAFDAGQRGHFLTKGEHKLTVRSREPGARLEQLWIGPFNAIGPSLKNGILLKAEQAKITPPMKLDRESHVPLLIGDRMEGQADFTFNVPEDGCYAVWAKSFGPNHSSDSFFLKLDNEDEFAWDTAISASWKPNQNGQPAWHRVVGRSFDFWVLPIAWLAASPDSPDSADGKHTALATRLLGSAIFNLRNSKAQPVQLWYIDCLEALLLLSRSPNSDAKNIERLKNELRPYVDATFKFAQINDNGWAANTPNIQFQAAAILTVAAEVWKNSDPQAAAEWRSTARDNFSRGLKWGDKGHPIGYGFNSGFDTTYFSYDGKYLTRYYQLSGDPEARETLAGMAAAASHTDSWGRIISLSSPWWKHLYETFNQPYMHVTSILEITRDPQLAMIIHEDLARNKDKNIRVTDWLIPYCNTFTPPVTLTLPPPRRDLTHYVPNENGPALRAGNLSVVMPFKPWCESTCGAYYSTPEGISSQVCSVILTAVTSGKIRGHYPNAYSVVEPKNPAPDFRASVISPEFIATAVSFRPALGGPALHVPLPENNSPWQRTDIWIAGKNGAAGSLELRALRDNDSIRVALWPHLSSNTVIDGNHLKTSGLTVTLEPRFNSKITKLGKTWASSPLDLFQTVLAEQPQGFRAGESFSSTVTISLNNSDTVTAGKTDSKDGLHSFEAQVGGKKYLLLFNASKNERQWTAANAWQSVDPSGQNIDLQPQVTSLPPGSLTVIPSHK